MIDELKKIIKVGVDESPLIALLLLVGLLFFEHRKEQKENELKDKNNVEKNITKQNADVASNINDSEHLSTI